MNQYNKGKIKATEIIAEMVQERLDEALERELPVTIAILDAVLKDISVYKMIVEKSEAYDPVLDMDYSKLRQQEEPGCDY